MPPPQLTPLVKTIPEVRLAGTSNTYNLTLSNNLIASATPNPASSSSVSSPPLALPALVHPHIHLDKAFIHNATPYTHLHPVTGSFAEALTSTTTAKSHFTTPDLLQRGEWLLAESVASGVTALRAFVEVDHTVHHTCLSAALTLKETWKEACEIQLVCFAQDPIFSTAHGEENRALVESALDNAGVDVLGTTPYVETSTEAAKRNIEWAVTRALELNKHLDFHLDYHLLLDKEPLIWYVLQILKEKGWTKGRTSKRVMCGHCTRLTLFSEEEWRRISLEIHQNDLPVSFVGLPTSDIYMAAAAGEPRGTLQVLKMIREYGLDAVIGVNNVGNAFTPWGSADPLSLACLGVGVYQAGTQADATLLYECVSTRARAAIGLSGTSMDAGESGSGLRAKEGDLADLLLVCDVDDTGSQVSRPRKSVAEVVWDPPARVSRVVVSKGRVKMPSLGSRPDITFHYD